MSEQSAWPQSQPGGPAEASGPAQPGTAQHGPMGPEGPSWASASPQAYQPYQPHQGHVRRAGKTRSPWGVWLLSLVTFGVYGLYWYYKVNEETREYERSVDVQPGIAVCALIFSAFTLGIAAIVSIVKTGGRISQAQRASGTTARCSGGLGLVLAVLMGTHLVYYQSQMNKIWARHGHPNPGTPL